MQFQISYPINRFSTQEAADTFLARMTANEIEDDGTSYKVVALGVWWVVNFYAEDGRLIGAV